MVCYVVFANFLRYAIAIIITQLVTRHQSTQSKWRIAGADRHVLIFIERPTKKVCLQLPLKNS